MSAKDLRKFGELEAEYRMLWNKPLLAYFDGQLQVSLRDSATYQQSVMSQENVKLLFKDFDRMTAIRETIDGISLEFLPWWKANRDFYVKTGWIQGVLQKSNLSLSDLHFEMYLQFVAQPGRIKPPGWTRRMLANLKPRAIIGTVLVAGVFVIREFKNIAIMGTGVQAYNGYMGTVNAQIVNKAQQVGAEYNASFAEWLNDRLNSKAKIHVAQKNLSDALQSMTEVNYDQMSFEEASVKWEESEKKLFALYQDFQKVMPAHLRDARAHFREMGLETPLRYATAMATFEIQFRQAKKEFEVYSAKTSLTQAEIKDRDYQKAVMESAQSSLAATLAIWRITGFMYREVATPGAASDENHQLLNSYNQMSHFFNFNFYAQKYTEQVNIVLKHMSFKFLAFDAVAEEFSKAQNERNPNSVSKAKRFSPKSKAPAKDSLKEKVRRSSESKNRSYDRKATEL